MRGSWRHRGVTVERLATDTVVQRTRDPFGRDGFEEFVHATADRLYRSRAADVRGPPPGRGPHPDDVREGLLRTGRKVVAADSPLAYSRTILTRTVLVAPTAAPARASSPWTHCPTSRLAGPDMAIARGPARSAAAAARPGTGRCWCCATGRTSRWNALPRSLGIRSSACRNRAARALARLRTLLPALTQHRRRDRGDLMTDLRQLTARERGARAAPTWCGSPHAPAPRGRQSAGGAASRPWPRRSPGSRS